MMNVNTPENEMRASARSLESARHLINTWELSDVFNYLLNKEKWNEKHIKEAIEQYRNFVYLHKKYHHQCIIPPSEDIDVIWHTHILHTNDYIRFCNAVFGEYLHHDPRHGYKHIVEGGELLSKAQLDSFFEHNTQKLYLKEFGTYLFQVTRTPFLTDFKRFILKSYARFLS